MKRDVFFSLACLTTCATFPGMAQRLPPAHPHHGPAVVTGASHYVANSGSDSNDGLAPERAWKTVGKVNQALTSMGPCDRVLFRRGDTFRDDSIRLMNQVNATSATTLATDPPRFSGNASCQFTIGAYGSGASPLIDGADPLTLKWSHVQGSTFSSPLAQLPSKLYVDPSKRRGLRDVCL